MATVNAKVLIHNMANLKPGFIVARADGVDLWYYGTYETQDRANEVAEKLGNGIVMEVQE